MQMWDAATRLHLQGLQGSSTKFTGRASKKRNDACPGLLNQLCVCFMQVHVCCTFVHMPLRTAMLLAQACTCLAEALCIQHLEMPQ